MADSEQDIDEVEDELENDEPDEVLDDDESSDDDADGADDEGTDDEADSSSSKPSGRASRSNAFNAVRERMGDKLRTKAKESDEDQDDADADDENADDENRSARAKENAGDRTSKKKGDAGDADDDDDGDQPRYEIVDENGDKFALDLPEKAKIIFAGDGKTIELKSVDELVALAQKGAAFDRVSSTAGQERAVMRTRISELETGEKENEELMFKLLFDELDDETREELRKELEPYRDPKVREGLDAKAKLTEREKSDERAARAEQARSTNEFWNATDKVIGKELPKYEYLDAEDADDIKIALHSVYVDHLKNLAAEYVKIAPEHGLSKEEAIAEAQRDAARIMNEKTLRRVMKDLDAKYAKRAGRGHDVRRESKAKREVDEHNKRVEDKRKQRRDPKHRSMRSGGSAPSVRETAREKKPVVGFENRISASLARMRRKVSASGRSNSEDDD